MNEELMIPTISLWQPWAAALVVDRPDQPGKAIKIWETRSWKIPEKFLGKRMLVHGAKKKDKVTEGFLRSFPLNRPANQRAIVPAVYYGAIIGSVIPDQCITTEEWLSRYKGKEEYAEEWALGLYDPDRFAWHCSGNVCFDKPILTRGFQKIWGTPISQIPSQYHHLFIC